MLCVKFQANLFYGRSQKVEFFGGQAKRLWKVTRSWRISNFRTGFDWSNLRALRAKKYSKGSSICTSECMSLAGSRGWGEVGNQSTPTFFRSLNKWADSKTRKQGKKLSAAFHSLAFRRMKRGRRWLCQDNRRRDFCFSPPMRVKRGSVHCRRRDGWRNADIIFWRRASGISALWRSTSTSSNVSQPGIKRKIWDPSADGCWCVMNRAFG